MVKTHTYDIAFISVGLVRWFVKEGLQSPSLMTELQPRAHMMEGDYHLHKAVL